MTDSIAELRSLILLCAQTGRLDLRLLGQLQVLVQASIAQEIAVRGGALGDPGDFAPPPRVPSPAEVFRSPVASAWVKSSIRRGLKGDVFAAYSEAALVAAVLRYELHTAES
ncbi:hypothetical protein LMG29542_05588 [Paraburkholderia humisilvae]|uniref:Uncharacterized protein n=1 Tax=Paraburkholderia humisilvae TaxID=627669 RepID=A0A6J5EQ73_9BURK|nr:hypothetical protein LMG29542_05588 [Paraburkholderia humisilvae]